MLVTYQFDFFAFGVIKILWDIRVNGWQQQNQQKVSSRVSSEMWRNKYLITLMHINSLWFAAEYFELILWGKVQWWVISGSIFGRLLKVLVCIQKTSTLVLIYKWNSLKNVNNLWDFPYLVEILLLTLCRFCVIYGQIRIIN